jgi:hypothetical protein
LGIPQWETAVQIVAQWENISESGLLGSEKQWLLEFTCYRTEMLKHSSEKLIFIPKKKRNERQSRRNPKFSGYHSSFPSRNDFLIKVLSEFFRRSEFQNNPI